MIFSDKTISHWITRMFFLIGFYPMATFAQSGSTPDVQLQKMKQDYQQWLSSRVESDLLVEYDPSPIALDIPKPRFSWTVDLQGRGRKQTAYQILVASTSKILDANEGDMWNSGLVESDQSTQVIYNGRSLESNKEYFWKVSIRDEAGKIHPYTKTGKFSTGLFNTEDWSADWIGRGQAGEVLSDVDAFLFRRLSPEVQNVIPEPRSPMFRREFTVEKKVRRARMFMAGLGLYEL